MLYPAGAFLLWRAAGALSVSVLESLATSELLRKLLHAIDRLDPGRKIGGIHDDAVCFPYRLVREVPGLLWLRPRGQVRREIGGVEQEERSAVTALGKIACGATGVFASTEFVQQ